MHSQAQKISEKSQDCDMELCMLNLTSDLDEWGTHCR